MQRPTIYSLQAMRAIAASLVVYHHAQHFLQVRGYIPQIDPRLEFGRAGVDIFFVISGFIMVFIAWDNFHKSGASKDFIIRRAIRIVPLYWIYLSVMTVLLVFLPEMFSKGKTFDVAHMIASYLFVPWRNSAGDIAPILSPGWTLSYELYFYFIFSLVLLLPRRYFMYILALCFVGGVIVGRLVEFKVPVLYMITSPLLLEFLMGCLVALLYKGGVGVSMRQALLLVFIATAMLLVHLSIGPIGLGRIVMWGVPAAFMIAGLVYLEKHGAIRVPRLLVQLGNSSYSLYLSHLFTINLIGVLWVKIIGGGFAFYIMVAFVASILIGHLSYVVMEKPITKSLTDWYHGRKRQVLGNEAVITDTGPR